jgi:5-methylcytosine-specific restriction protein A
MRAEAFVPVAPPRKCSGCRQLVPPGPCRTCRAQRDQDRDNADVRKWYRTSRWRRLRASAFRRDPLCAKCKSLGLVKVGTDADHRIPHDGDPRLFWELSNVQVLCAKHHSAKTRGEQLRRRQDAGDDRVIGDTDDEAIVEW